MFDFLQVHDGPVVKGLEEFETVYGAGQPQYLPLRTLPADVNPPDIQKESGVKHNSAISRWHPTTEQRQAIAAGADILLEVFHFGNPLMPVRVMVSDRCDLGGSFPDWFTAQTRAPYTASDAAVKAGE